MQELIDHINSMIAKTDGFSTGWRQILSQEDVEKLAELAKEAK